MFIQNNIIFEEWAGNHNTILNIKYVMSNYNDLTNEYRGRKNSKIEDIKLKTIDIEQQKSNSVERKGSDIRDNSSSDDNKSDEDTIVKISRRMSKSIDSRKNTSEEVKKNIDVKIVDYSHTKTHIYYKKDIGKNFCESFFISGLTKDSRLILNSEGFNPTCGHKDCAILPSFKPDILFKYPATDSNLLELNNSVLIINIDSGIMLPIRY